MRLRQRVWRCQNAFTNRKLPRFEIKDLGQREQLQSLQETAVFFAFVTVYQANDRTLFPLLLMSAQTSLEDVFLLVAVTQVRQHATRHLVGQSNDGSGRAFVF